MAKAIKNTFKAPAKLGTELANAFDASRNARGAAEETFKAKLGEIESSWITLLKAKASEHENMTAAEYDATVHPDVIARLEAIGYKMARAVASQVKVAFLAFCHGVEVKDEFKSNFQNFVNKQARAELGALKVIKHTPKGPKTPTAKAETPTAIDAFASLFKGDKAAKTWRRDALRAIAKADPAAKLFDAMLSDILDTLEIEI